MDTKQFKKIIKEAVKEVFQEEMREILLEAVKAPKATIVTESTNTSGNNSMFNNVSPSQPTKTLTAVERKAMFGGMLEEMQNGTLSATSNNIPFKPVPGRDTTSGALPPGEVDFSQIMGLMSR